NLNDLAMFDAADRCYAVGNAVPELKKAADGIIPSNEEYGVPMFIEKELFPAVGYIPPEGLDPARFEEAVQKALNRGKSTIGTLNEKVIHNALKCYYCDEEGHEAKLGAMYADGVNESGIFEIQSANFNYLAKKLMFMLSASHVTVVYPFEKKTRSYAINSQTGEVMSVTSHTENSYSKLFLELYRLKAFITNPNLTIRIAFLETDKKLYYKDERRIRRKGMKREKIPTALIGELVLDKPEDYRVFLPEGLPERFTKAVFGKLCRPTDAGIMLSVLEFTGVIRRCGKHGNAIEYTVIQKETPDIR
ncbi:MAG: HAD hydrolase family protein, partial [Ruminiclostridium sp.]|nr:HAD hydrolase family protein [Ruminiclostridium sp.]